MKVEEAIVYLLAENLMTSYTGTDRDVADSWYTGDFETTYNDILAGCEAMLRQDI